MTFYILGAIYLMVGFYFIFQERKNINYDYPIFIILAFVYIVLFWPLYFIEFRWNDKE